MTGTADIVGEDYIRDTKLSWSKKTFPLFEEDAGNPMYEWQLRAYMMLYNKELAYLDYCLIQTNPALIPKWESSSLHDVNDLPLKMRVTTLCYQRDLGIESMIIEKVEQCRMEWNRYKKKFNIN